MVGSFVSFYAVTRFQLHVWPAAIFPVCRTRSSSSSARDGHSPVHDRLCGAGRHHRTCRVQAAARRPRIAALITAIGCLLLEFFGALSFVFSPRFIPTSDRSTSSPGTPRTDLPGHAGQAPPVEYHLLEHISHIVAASVLTQLLLQFLCAGQRSGRPCAPPPSTSRPRA